jgi:alkanesulfonate monooxygenase SsuD/methylene tetrahydromethanopterin reductase-like flavin-dependent oxidoreductase (luciferase family)
VWEGGSLSAELLHVEAILGATSTVKGAAGIVNVWRAGAVEVARSYHHIEAAYPGRFLLGIGSAIPSPPPRTTRPTRRSLSTLTCLTPRGCRPGGGFWRRPGEGAAAGRNARGRRALYLVTPGHSRQAREIGAEHPDTLIPTQSCSLDWRGRSRGAARDQWAASLPIEERVPSTDHPRSVATRVSLAY